VGGAIGGVVLLGAIFAIAWYKIRTYQKSKDTEPAVIPPHEGPEGDSPDNYRTEKNHADDTELRYPAVDDTHMIYSDVDDTRLRYPTDLASGNLSTTNY
jgi:hypothetical protein